jgi:hypothetical protein
VPATKLASNVVTRFCERSLPDMISPTQVWACRRRLMFVTVARSDGRMTIK